MALMERIKVKPFLKFSYQEQISFIQKIQKLRTNEMEIARTTRGKGMTKSAAKNIVKRKGNRVVDSKKKAIAALKKLNLEQLKVLKDLL